MKSDTCSEKLSKVQICLTAAVFLICLAGAYLIKIEYTPDEYARRRIMGASAYRGMIYRASVHGPRR